MAKDTLELIRGYLQDARMMQIATVEGSQPWICTVYFAPDDALNLYWLSLPSRRHSQDIASGSKVAVAIPVKFDKPVIGIQAEGAAHEVTEPGDIANVMQKYVGRYNSGQEFYDNFVAGKNKHKLYKFTPRKFVLFDEVTFPVGQGRKELSL